MDIKEAYKVMQAAWIKDNDIKVGDTVRVVRKFKEDELGYNGVKGTQFGVVGQVETIQDKDGIELEDIGTPPTGESRWFPFFALEFVSHAVAENMIEINGKKWSEATIAEALKKHAG